MFQAVSMEPSAYAYFRANGEYADGTMFLLSFYAMQQNGGDETGLNQGDLDSFEIHVIDKGLYQDGRGPLQRARERWRCVNRRSDSESGRLIR